jgi:hypothetical protein
MDDKRTARISFYIVAHADDGQLFMQPNIYLDLVASDCKIVFIITTAGDAGMGATYWLAREEGLKSSVRFCLTPSDKLSEAEGEKACNSHMVHYWSVNNVTCYFLRLPDGGLDGNGFTENHYQSLSKFSAGHIDTITAIDQSTVYHSWLDFYTTLQTIISQESTGLPDVLVNYQNPDASANPHDHPDHIATGQAIQAMPIVATYRQALFTGYSSGQNSENLSPEYLFWKAAMFAAYEKAVYDQSGYSTLHEGISVYLNWCISNAKFITIDPRPLSA